MFSSKLYQKIEIFKQDYGLLTTAILVFLIVTKGFLYISALYYFIIPILITIILGETIFAGKSRTNLQLAIYYLPFIFWILVSSFWSIHPEVTIQRAIYFVFLVIGMASLSNYVQQSAKALVKVFLPTIVIVVVVSVLSLIAGFPADYWSGGNGLGLKGFTTHQNMLGSLMYLTVALMNYWLFTLFTAKGVKNKSFWFSALLNMISLFVLIITFSRSAILAYCIFLQIFVFVSLGAKKTTGLITFFVISFMILSKIGSSKQFINYVIYKGSDRVVSSRSVMYKASLSAAKNGGLFGLGYGVSDPSLTSGVPGSENGKIFIREKGSTVLGLIEETGLVGMVLFYLPIGILIIKAWKGNKLKLRDNNKTERSGKYDLRSQIDKKENHTNEKMFLIAIIIAMIVHSQFEAWGVGVGSVLLPLYLFNLARLKSWLN